MSQFVDVPVTMWLQLFDVKIQPILHYGAEVWGFHSAPNIEIVHTKFCKFVLGLGRNAPNVAARGELGRHSLISLRLQKITKYWLKLLKHEETRYVKVCYNFQYELAERGRDCWGSNVKKCYVVAVSVLFGKRRGLTMKYFFEGIRSAL